MARWIWCVGLILGLSLGTSLGQVLFVADTGNGTIGEYDATTGAAINPSLITGLDDPMGITISGNDLFVANNGNGTVGEYTLSGQTVDSALVTGIGITFDSTFIPCANDVAIAGSQIFVSKYVEYAGGGISVYAPSGQPTSPYSISPQSLGIAIAGPNLFVSDYGNTSSGSISEWSTDGDLENVFGTSNPPYGMGLAEPSEIAVAGSDVFVADSGHSYIREYTTSGTLLNTIVDYGPQGIATLGSDVFVTNYDGTVSEYTTSGDLINASLISGLGAGNPWGIAAVLPEPGRGGTCAIFAARGLVRRRRKRI